MSTEGFVLFDVSPCKFNKLIKSADQGNHKSHQQRSSLLLFLLLGNQSLASLQLCRFLQVEDLREPQLDMHFFREGFLCLPMKNWLCMKYNFALSFEKSPFWATFQEAQTMGNGNVANNWFSRKETPQQRGTLLVRVKIPLSDWVNTMMSDGERKTHKH